MATQVTLSTMTTMRRGSQTGCCSVHRTLTTTRRLHITAQPAMLGGTGGVRHPASTAAAGNSGTPIHRHRMIVRPRYRSAQAAWCSTAVRVDIQQTSKHREVIPDAWEVCITSASYILLRNNSNQSAHRVQTPQLQADSGPARWHCHVTIWYPRSGAIFYRCSIVTEHLSPTVFSIFGPNICYRTRERTNTTDRNTSWWNNNNYNNITRPDSVHSDFGALQIIYLLTYLLTSIITANTAGRSFVHEVISRKLKCPIFMKFGADV